MRNIYFIILTLSFIALTACGKSYSNELIIREKFFIAQINDIYANPKNYLGKTIKYEGIFDIYSVGKDKKFYTVFRYGPGCCGPDAYAGFEIVWDDKNKEYPKPNDWVEVVGVLENYEVDKIKFLRIRLLSVAVLEKRGKEIVLR
jgi:uncharacterized membrane protein YcgQ (UPF0703/DUF1980 family)